MTKFIIKGGQPLIGGVRLGGAKNASFKIMIASLLCRNRSRLLNLAKIGDVEITRSIIEALGAQTRPCGERTIFIDPQTLSNWKMPEKFGEISRASILFIAPLIQKFGRALIPFPGGDKIGRRPVERHLAGFKKLGGEWKYRGDFIYFSTPNGLHGSHYRFDKNTHTGTENLIMLAVCAKGTTILENAAEETEIDDLIYFLNKAGAKITRLPGRKIRINGTPDKLSGQTHAVIADANEAASYACAAFITKGDIAVEGAREKDLTALLKKIKKCGGKYKANSWGIRFWYENPLKAVNITTKPYPGFKTDWQPLWTALATQMEGESKIIEAVHQCRFGFVPALQEMGADIEYYQPKIKNPAEFYNFNWEETDRNSKHGIKITGPSRLIGAKLKADDLRHGATLTIAALAAEGTSIIKNAEIINRGYEDLGKKLQQLGGRIEIIKENNNG